MFHPLTGMILTKMPHIFQLVSTTNQIIPVVHPLTRLRHLSAAPAKSASTRCDPRALGERSTSWWSSRRAARLSLKGSD